MPSACDPVRAALAAYRDGGPPPNRSAEGAAHLEACEECRTALEDLVGASDEQVVARAFAHVQAGSGFAARVVARLADETGSQAPAAAVEDSTGEDEDEELAELLAAGARFAGGGPAGRSGMGMVIEYCSTCRERIDAADFKTGAAIQFRGQNYCAGCKVEVLPELEDDPEFIAQQERQQRSQRRKSDRQPAAIGSGIRPGMGRAVRREAAGAGAGGPNVMMLGGIAAGVLVLIVAVVLMMSGGTGSTSNRGKGGGTSVAKNRKHGKSKSKSKSKSHRKSGGATPVEPTPPGKPSMEQIMAVRTALKSLREKRTEASEFAKKNTAPEQWQNVDLHYKNLLEDAAWNDPAIQDNTEVKELRTGVEADRKLARERFENAGNEMIGKKISRAIFFATREDFGRAMHTLDEIPPIYRNLEKYKEVAQTREKIDKMARTKMGEIGKWIDLTHDKWKLNPPHQVVKGDDGATVIRGIGDQMGLAIFTSNSSSAWGDYEIEMDAKVVYPEGGPQGQNLIKMGLRVTRNAETNQLQGAAFAFKGEFAGDYHKFSIKVEGQSVKGTMDGQTVQESSARGNWRGKPILLIPPGCELHIKSARLRLNSFGKRPGG